MSEAGNFEPRRRRNRKKVNLESAVAEAESFLASKKKKRKQYVSFFSRNPVTGERSTHCKYRPRKRRTTSTVSGRCMTFADCLNSSQINVNSSEVSVNSAYGAPRINLILVALILDFRIALRLA